MNQNYMYVQVLKPIYIDNNNNLNLSFYLVLNKSIHVPTFSNLIYYSMTKILPNAKTRKTKINYVWASKEIREQTDSWKSGICDCKYSWTMMKINK